MNFLTKNQQQTYRVIKEFTEKHGIAPTNREIAKELGVSDGGAHVRVRGLIARGAATRPFGMPRGITLLPLAS